MNNFKRIFLLAAIGLSAFSVAFDTQAQFFGGIAGSQPIYPFASTNYNTTNSQITGAWTNSYILPPTSFGTNAGFPLVDCYNTRQIALQLSASGTTNTAITSLSLIRSTDGVLWETSPFVLLSLSCATGAASTTNLTFDMGGFRYFTALAWTNTGGLSNAIVRYGQKPGF